MINCIAYIIIGTSMLPTVTPGDTLVACPSDTVRRDDIVVADLGRKHPLVKRVTGIEGDLLTHDPDQAGSMFIADPGLMHFDCPHFSIPCPCPPTPGREVYCHLVPDFVTKARIPKNHFYVKSDNPNNHFDSRRFGLIDRSRIRGVVIQHRRRGR